MTAFDPTLAARVAESGIPMSAHLVQDAAEGDPATQCRCGEPGADPYSCEAEDCTATFSELNPFAGARPVNVASAEVSRKCGRCEYRTSVWHVDDGSAEAELHEHVVRVHVGTASEATS